jgi:membrane-associated phospholipid phosphatase
MRTRPWHASLLAAMLLCAARAPLRAQQVAADSQPCAEPPARAPAPDAGGWHARSRLLIGAALLVAAAADRPLRDAAARHERRALDRAAERLEPLGRAHILVPALAVSVALPALAGRRVLARRMLHVAVDYVAADALESALKPLVGRHRPIDGGGAWRFAPLRNDTQWHSFPSAHTVHTFAIADGLAAEFGDARISGPAFALAGLVGVERVYTREHWSSDVVGSAMLAGAVTRGVTRWLDRPGARRCGARDVSGSPSLLEPR